MGRPTTSTLTPRRLHWPSSLGARKLVILTDVAGVYAHWPDTTEVISQLSVSRTARHDAVPRYRNDPEDDGLPDRGRRWGAQAHILDGRVAHAVLLEIFTNEGLGHLDRRGSGSES